MHVGMSDEFWSVNAKKVSFAGCFFFWWQQTILLPARRKYSYSLQRNPKPFWTVVLRTDAAGGQRVRHLSQRPDRRSVHRNGRTAGRHSHQISGPTQVRRTSMQDQPHQTSSCGQQRLGGDLLGCISMLPYLILLLIIRSPNGETILSRRAKKKK